MKTPLICLGALLFASSAIHAQQQADVEGRAMHDEMQRSMKELHLDTAEHPYYIAYKIVDLDRQEAHASFGALTSSNETRTRVLTVNVRVGSYDFDNSNFTSSNLSASELLGSFFGGATVLPIDDSYDELRRKIWLATDSAYKAAVEELSGKKAAQANRNRSEAIPDFSKEPARQESEAVPPVSMKMMDAEHLVRTTSAVFRDLPMVEGSSAELEVVNSTEHFLNSEGTSYLRQVPAIYFHASASVQHTTGEIFNDSYSAYGRSLSELPNEATLVAGSKEVAVRLNARRRGKVSKRYNGPVLLVGQSAAELFAHNFVNQLSARPRSSSDGRSPLMALIGGNGASLINKVGSRVLPDFLTVTDNPQLTQADGKTLFGNYKFDEEGVPSRETVLIRDGILKTLLTSRAPARGMLESTGNMREHGVGPGNIFIEASKSVSTEDLKSQLIELLKTRNLEFGIIVRRLSGNVALEASRVYPDGHEESLRDARVAEITPNSFKDILAVSKERTVYTERATITSLFAFSPFSSADLVTYVVPDMLFEDMSVEHLPNESPKLPNITSPLAAE